MAQQSWKIEKDDADCEVLKPPSPASSSPPAAAPPMYVGSAEESPAERPGKGETAAVVPDLKAAPAAEGGEAAAGQARAVRFTNRCSSCQKRVGLTGFRCRCGDLFCGRHRYSDAHDCSFDYKAAGREQISKANPLIRAAKIIKI